jgi:hypothetical protein
VKRILFRLAVAVITFNLGVALALIWSFQRTTTAIPCLDCESKPTSAVLINEDDFRRALNTFQEIHFSPPPNSVDEAYVLSWTPSFDHPVTVVVWRSGLQAFMCAKTINGEGSSIYGQVVEINNRPLTSAEWRQLTAVLNETSFWDIPATVNEEVPEDGAVWRVMVFRQNQYRWAIRRVPEAPFADFCQHLIRLSGLETAHELYLPQYLLR